MAKKSDILSSYFRKYRVGLGFGNQNKVKRFFRAKDIVPAIDFSYIEELRKRLREIADLMNKTVTDELKIDDIEAFKREHIDEPLKIMQTNNIFPKLNNQGRRPEEVFYSWMLGFMTASFFSKALGFIFNIEASKIRTVGDDDFRDIETFKRTAKADLELELNDNERFRIEMQSAFSGKNDIKKHKITEAIRVFQEQRIRTLVVHFDIYNGQVAFVRLDEIDVSKKKNFKTRKEMEGQEVFEIPQKYFVWNLPDRPIKYRDMNLDYHD